jgi:hypothetical protein
MVHVEWRIVSHTKCPDCRGAKVARLDVASAEARVHYYRCGECGHVWNIPKDDPDAPPRSVTLKPPPSN